VAVPCCYFKGDLWRLSDTEFLSGHKWGEVGMWACFLTKILCVCSCVVMCNWCSQEEAWCALESLGDSCATSHSPSVITLVDPSIRPGDRGWSGLV
jgi:hypothetical protein